MNILTAQRDIYTVSRLNTEVKMMLEGSFPLLWIEGEISNLSRPSSGHLYFTLKDAHAQVSCAMFRNRGRLLSFHPGNGQQVLVRARVTLYDVRGNYQLSIEHMEPAGDGALRRRFDELKARLDKEGLFAEEHKRALPSLPKRIGVITSASGAAIRDVLTVLRRRFPAVPVRIYPVPVQGSDSAQRITDAIALADRRQDCDLLILTRGGGSLEDMWSFNEEIVARAIHAVSIPTISAVGHEIDVTIADFVADRRAATPSAAAEMAVPDQRELQYRVAQLGRRLAQRTHERQQAIQTRFAHLLSRLQRTHPQAQLRTSAQRLDELEMRMQRALKQHQAHRDLALQHLKTRLEQRHPERQLAEVGQRLHALDQSLGNRVRTRLREHVARLTNEKQHLAAVSPAAKITLERVRLDAVTRRLRRAQRYRLQAGQDRLRGSVRSLHTISPLATLERGYAIARDASSGTVLQDAKQVSTGDKIEIRLAKGVVDCVVTGTHETPGRS
ncbi:MAG: exodeoxyribonuclease VII large subunit [Gammaproteobacteria bacterium]|nr:exodeoxyribonuclease VII large subunit [Gammaproteobacteria bacterium]MCP5135772.1 exodeoxyribonuclease VII large subunit [Gammaproteobacteria bacterium]